MLGQHAPAAPESLTFLFDIKGFKKRLWELSVKKKDRERTTRKKAPFWFTDFPLRQVIQGIYTRTPRT